MKCKNEKFMSTVGLSKLSKSTEIDFDVQRNLPDCQKIVANKILSTEATGARFDRFKIPSNQFECMRNDCVNTGTYYNGGAETKYKFKLDAIEFAGGVFTFYALPPASNSATAVVQLSDTSSFTNADKYTVNLADIATASDGFAPIVIDLTQTPTDVGTGWSKTGDAIYVSIELTGATTDEEVGLSTISFFESMDDFAVSTHVIARCLSSVDGSWDLDTVEQTCFRGGGFDTSDLQGFDKTVSFKGITPNYWRMSPLYNKGKAVTGFDKETVEAVVKELSGTDYGQVVLDDLYQEECRFISIQVLYDCRDAQNITDSLLERLSIPTKVDMDEAHYQLIDNGDGTTTILFNKSHIGRSVLISYPKAVAVDNSFILSDESVNDIRTSMTYTKCYTDGTKWRFVYNNVYVTSFPDALPEDDDAEGEFTISIQRDADGKFGYAYRVIG